MGALQRIAGSCLVRSETGAAVLVRDVWPGEARGAWSLPGARVRHGEHPRTAALRGAWRTAGLRVVAPRLHAVGVETLELPDAQGVPVEVHVLHVVYAASPAPGVRLPEPDGQPVRLVAHDDLPGLPLTPVALRALTVPGVDDPRRPEPAADDEPRTAEDVDDPLVHDPGDGDADGDGDGDGDGGAPRVQRAGAYAVCVATVPPTPDGLPGGGVAGRRDAVPAVLLTRITGSGRWTLPGGGIDPGEDPEDAVRREVHEEAGLALATARLVGVDSLRFTGTAPDGRREDFHGVRVIYAGEVPTDVPPRVVEVDGTTDAAAWVSLEAVDARGATALVRTALGHVL